MSNNRDDSVSLFGDAINRRYFADEDEVIGDLLPLAQSTAPVGAAVEASARRLVESVRANLDEASGLQAFLRHYDLSSDEGVVLMCLAEALLRIPDHATVDAFIADRLTRADWQRHLGESESLFVNASTWALMLTGKVLRYDRRPDGDPGEVLGKLLARLEEPVLRGSLKAAMGIMAAEFVMGRDIDEAVRRAATAPFTRYRCSYDMLGEAALTADDAEAYEKAYAGAIAALANNNSVDVLSAPGISVKLSALCPRFEATHESRVFADLCGRVRGLAVAARDAGISMTLDAEESDVLLLTLKVFEHVYLDPTLDGWSGFGIAVQAYQKRALDVLASLNRLAITGGRVIPVRLVKGAYWDTEIKYAQIRGLSGYPVFTTKCHTDVSYLACARYLLAACQSLYPQFATHNAHTVSYVHHHADEREFEFQRLHGMGEELYAEVTAPGDMNRACRIYAPVGAHEDLLPYLVRRLLENGANTSFVNRIAHDDADMSAIIADPVTTAETRRSQRTGNAIPLPRDIYLPVRKNSPGYAYDDPGARAELSAALVRVRERTWDAGPVIDGETSARAPHDVHNPARLSERVGRVADAEPVDAERALDAGASAFAQWSRVPVGERAGVLDRAADRIQQALPEIAALCVLEAGKTLPDAADDVREAIDFLRYYAAEARRVFVDRRQLPGPTGESNELLWRGRGLCVCISPWNFPVAIFTGQIAAALVAGNTVIAKPAEQTALVAGYIVEQLYAAGIPDAVLSFLPGDGPTLGSVLLADPRVAGVAFTGSNATANRINRTLATRDGALPVFIAETGGINAMIADSSALPEQLVADVVSSAFNSAGQRCSALRLLCLQEEIAERTLRLLIGFMGEWVIGDPALFDTDMGPVIDQDARRRIQQSVESAEHDGRLLYRGEINDPDGYFLPPAIIEINSFDELGQEIFGPVLHVLRFRAANIENLVDGINALGYGLTLGVHSRIEGRAEAILERARVGNVYVNRDIIGARVGSQPFGGMGLSGTGPKAGGPNYLTRFAVEQTCTVNTAAIGGNATLLGGDPMS